ncbi:hypothetical protein ACIRPX_42780 [Streptomyces sp. NPDC101225]|uniref:hypothetical protein n=1 Tax=Streptomyces sp. NPDC101225 TaxID=3366135 RepID=UPI0038245B65
MIRSTRRLDLVNTMDAKLIAAAFGMDPQATLNYLADRIDERASRLRSRAGNDGSQQRLTQNCGHDGRILRYLPAANQPRPPGSADAAACH